MPTGERYRKLGQACLAQAVMMADSAARATVLTIAQSYMRLADHLSGSGERDAARAEQTAPQPDKSAAKPLPARKLVIVLDDEISVRMALGRILTAYGFDSELFGSVREFHSCAKLDQAICLFLDINLHGESGIEVRRRLAVTNPGLPVVLMTANDSEGTRQAARDLGCRAYLSKPFSASSFINAIEKASTETIHSESGLRQEERSSACTEPLAVDRRIASPPAAAR